MIQTKKKLKRSLLLLLFIIAFILYMLADRYLIEHVEVTVQKPSTEITDVEANAAEPAESVESDDWNYKSSNIDIHIEKIQRGTGSDIVTYFVADVKLKDSYSLKSAFAKDTFGRNIVETTSKIASDHNAIFAINGDYYGFRSDGVLIRNGEVYRDEPVRTAAALLKDGTLLTFEESQISSDELLSKGVLNTLSFGPVLVKNGTPADDFEKVSIDKNFGNHSIQGTNPRTGIGVIEPTHYVFVVVDGRMRTYSKGMTLSEFAELFVELGCQDAYNLDGGGSSTMYFMGRVVNNPLGRNDEREISDILYIGE